MLSSDSAVCEGEWGWETGGGGGEKERQDSKQSASHSRRYLSSINEVKPGDNAEEEKCHTLRRTDKMPPPKE